MPWKLNFVENPKVVEIIYSGEIPPSELLEAFMATVEYARQQETLLYLADCTEMTGGHSVIDLYGLIPLAEAVGVDRRSKEALLMPQLQSSAEEVLFYETASRNRGFNVRIFRERAEALAWLGE